METRIRARFGRHVACAALTTLLVGLTASAVPAAVGAIQTGLASWYGDAHHGRRTASGDVFDQEELTAAHPSLPFGTIVRVTNVNNGRSVDVRVNDRGPVVGGRILDLSRAAARRIRAIGAGVVRVRMEIVDRPATSAALAVSAAGVRETPAPTRAVARAGQPTARMRSVR